MIDSMLRDGLWCAFDDQHMGEGTDRMNEEYGVAREDADAWAARSHARAAAAWDAGRFDDEVIAVAGAAAQAATRSRSRVTRGSDPTPRRRASPGCARRSPTPGP